MAISRDESKDFSKRIAQEVRLRSAAECQAGGLEVDLKHAIVRAENAERNVEALKMRLMVCLLFFYLELL